jgi:hypothetical protein
MTINLLTPEEKTPSVYQRSSRMARCLFCDMPMRESINHKLCSNCLIDPIQTRIALGVQREGTLKQYDAAQDAWQSAKDEADTDTLIRWSSAEVACIPPEQAFARSWATRNTAQDALSALLRAYERYTQDTDRIGAELARLEAAREEIEAAL